jgi:hypothetical protein
VNKGTGRRGGSRPTPVELLNVDERRYLVCETCGEVMPLENVFVFADECMLVCRICSTAEVWRAEAGPASASSTAP